MAFLRNGNNKTTQNLGTTVISQGTAFVGELTLDAKLHIDGTFQGTINSTSDISIGATGHFEGTLTAARLMVSGYAKGQFQCERLEIVESGKLYGEVVSEEFVIEPGGRFVGGSRSRSEEPVPALEHEVQIPKAVRGPDKKAGDDVLDAEFETERS